MSDRCRGAILAVAVLMVGWGCGAGSTRSVLLRQGALDLGDMIADRVLDQVTVMGARFSPDSDSVMLHVHSVSQGESSLWIYDISEGRLLQNELRSGWTLVTAAYMPDGEHVVLAVERPAPPSFRLYRAAVGSDEWENLTDRIESIHPRITQIAPAPDGETFAVVSIADGHPDLTVSRDGEVLAETQVFPGWVRIVAWDRNGRLLFVESDTPLDLGMRIEERQNAGYTPAEAEHRAVVYAVDVTTGNARIASEEEIPDLAISGDGKWKLHEVTTPEGIVEIFLTQR